MTDIPKVQRGSALLFWGTAATVIVIDQITKLLAERHLIRYVPKEIIGDVVRFTLAYNPGAAFSMSLGENSRYIFGAFALIALFVLWRLYRLSGPANRAGDRMRILALGLAWGGAAGNLLDRIRSSHGVVDFIDVGVNSWRFWTFNVADSAVTIGALVLAWSLSREDRQERDDREARESAALASDGGESGALAGDAVKSDAARGASGPDA